MEQSPAQNSFTPGNELAINNDDKASERGGGREHLISTAVKFLLNPRLRQTSVSQKLQFLRQKGLTEHEITSVCQRAGIDATQVSKETTVPSETHVMPYMYPFVAATVWTKARDVANLVALVSIGSFGIYYLWKEFLAPKIFGTRTSRDENSEKLLMSISKLNENITELKNLIRSIQETQALQRQIEDGSGGSKSKTSYELKEIKNELSAIKGLLLGRTQFPTSPSGSGGIPSWQMLEAEGDEEGDQSNTSKDSSKSKRKERKSQRKQDKSSSSTAAGAGGGEEAGKPEEGTEGDSVTQFVEMTGSSSSTVNIVRKPTTTTTTRSSGEGDSNGGFTSGSSCEVVYLGGKNYSNSETSSE